MSHRPYPDRKRARRQIQRATYRTPCTRCQHPQAVHAVEDGERVCTRGEGLISCRDCAELWARMPLTAAMQEIARRLSARPALVLKA